MMVGNGKGAGGDYGTGRRQDLTTGNRWGTPFISDLLCTGNTMFLVD